jgi:predicted nucleotide-binding protein (sugar kinase/HSP70/actin superfamily)
MENITKKDLIEVINKSTEDLHKQIDMFRYLITTILDKRVIENSLHRFHLPVSHYELRLKESIQEAIEELEETKKAFKSKRLEVLRRKLTSVLIDTK